MKEVDRFFSDEMQYSKYIEGMDMSPDSVIIDLGTYTGGTSITLSRLYNCVVYSFEPMMPYYHSAVVNCSPFSKISVFNYGLGKGTYAFKMSTDNDATSMFAKVNPKTALTCYIRDFFEFLHETNTHTVDLLHVNIEGAEYDLLDYIFSKDFQTKIRHLVVQFHSPSVKNNDNILRYFDILSKTHTCIYDYKYVWTRWDRKPITAN